MGRVKSLIVTSYVSYHAGFDRFGCFLYMYFFADSWNFQVDTGFVSFKKEVDMVMHRSL